MSSFSTPEVPPYRITLYYGPEPGDGTPPRLSCIFNVKKRSWKSGVHVAVEVTEEQMARARQVVGLAPWLSTVLAKLPEEERGDYESRARDAFVQGLCGLKLHLAIDAGLRQETRLLRAGELVGEVDGAVPKDAAHLKAQILTELDLTV